MIWTAQLWCCILCVFHAVLITLYYVCTAVPRCKGVCHSLQELPQWYDEYHTATRCMYRHSVSVRVSVGLWVMTNSFHRCAVHHSFPGHSELVSLAQQYLYTEYTLAQCSGLQFVNNCPTQTCQGRTTHPTPPSTGPRRLSVRGRPVDGRIGQCEMWRVVS